MIFYKLKIYLLYNKANFNNDSIIIIFDFFANINKFILNTCKLESKNFDCFINLSIMM